MPANCQPTADAGAVPVVDEIGAIASRKNVHTEAREIAAPQTELLCPRDSCVNDGLGQLRHRSLYPSFHSPNTHHKNEKNGRCPRAMTYDFCAQASDSSSDIV